MKKIVLASCLLCFFATTLLAQDNQPTQKESKKKANLATRANDHFMLQLGYLSWTKKPDTINTKGLPRSFNMYLMLDFPFKSDHRFSFGLGAGIGTDNMYFDKTYVGIKDITPTLQFHDLSDTSHFKKYKLTTAWLEAPIELRFSADPANPKKSWKGALGIKIGTLLAAHTKGKTWVDKNDKTLIPYTQKELSKRFFNSNRFVATARISHGVFGLFASYQLNPLFKEGFAPDVRTMTIGISLSGL